MHTVIETPDYLQDAKDAGLSGGEMAAIIQIIASDPKAGDVPVFMLAVIKKGDRDNLSKAECNALRKELQGIADAYRTSVKARAVKRRMKL